MTEWSPFSRPTAAVVVIGNEILSGRVLDTNSHFLCKRLHDSGIEVKRVSVVSDSIDDIADEIAQCSSKYVVVFTSGGVGPTHDDVTYEGIAKAFNEELIFSEEFFRAFENLVLSPSRKLAVIPKSSVIITVPCESEGAFPFVSYRNIYVLPGIPEHFEACAQDMKNLLHEMSGLKTFHEVCLYLNCSEYQVADILRKVVSHFKDSDNIQFGSYPEIENGFYKVKLTIRTDTKESLDKAEAYLRSVLPMNCVTYPVATSGEASVNALYALAHDTRKYVGKLVLQATKALEECFDQYSPFDTLALAFNGGKDCTALLHLTTGVLQKWCHKNNIEMKKLHTIYIQCPDAFPEIENFVEQTVARYNLNLHCYSGSQKESMWQVWSQLPNVRAVLMGTRQTDPDSEELSLFTATDKGWPPHIRVCPMLTWTYHDIWEFLRHLNVPYCSLYDHGYTSLGSRDNTKPNRFLLDVSEDGEVYLPAYLLDDLSVERGGRISTAED